MSPLITLPKEKLEREARRIAEREAGDRAWNRENRRVFWQCIALAFTGVPVYGLSMALHDPRQVEIARSAAFFVTWGLPYFRWLAFHVKRME